ncbi:MAG: hypothetical protein WCG25_07170 [bacterium]
MGSFSCLFSLNLFFQNNLFDTFFVHLVAHIGYLANGTLFAILSTMRPFIYHRFLAHSLLTTL